MQNHSLVILGFYDQYPFLRPGILLIYCLFSFSISFADQVPDIETLKKRSLLDDYYSSVVFGYNIINQTQKYASRYTGNKLNCTNCHRKAGTVADQFPLYIAGIYPHWRAKTGRLTDLGLMIRECFVNSLNGVMPPANAVEVRAIKTYISYLSNNQMIGQTPEGRGVSVLAKSGQDPNPIDGRIVYQQQCTGCHGVEGEGLSGNPPVWGMNSYTEGSGLNDIQLAAAFIKTKMSTINQAISAQNAWNVAAFLHKQSRPVVAGQGKMSRLLQSFAIAIGLLKKE